MYFILYFLNIQSLNLMLRFRKIYKDVRNILKIILNLSVISNLIDILARNFIYEFLWRE